MNHSRALRTFGPMLLIGTLLALALSFVSDRIGLVPTVSLWLGANIVAAQYLHPATLILRAAADAPRNTISRPGEILELPIAADTVIYQGTLVARDADGRAVPASDTAGLRVVGRAENTYNNDGGAAGALTVTIRLGCFKFDNSATQAIDADDVGKMAVVEDDQTVAETSNNLVSAGRITGVDSDGVWIDTRHAFYGPKTVPALTSTDGVMAAAADDAATKAEGEKIGDDVRALHASLFG